MYVIYCVFLNIVQHTSSGRFSAAIRFLPSWHKEIAHAYFFRI
jgi:hypothetical protein